MGFNPTLPPPRAPSPLVPHPLVTAPLALKVLQAHCYVGDKCPPPPPPTSKQTRLNHIDHIKEMKNKLDSGILSHYYRVCARVFVMRTRVCTNAQHHPLHAYYHLAAHLGKYHVCTCHVGDLFALKNISSFTDPISLLCV